MSAVAEDMKAALRWDGEPVHVGAHVHRTPDKPAVVMAETGASLTFREVDELANRASRLFRSLGLDVGDHIALCLENRLDFLPICIAAHYAGLFFTPISPRFTLDEIGYILQDCGAQAFITSTAMRDLAAQLDCKNRYVVDGELAGYRPFFEEAAAFDSAPLPDRIDGRGMLYSSGTTGRPKGVKVRVGGDPVGKPDLMARTLHVLFGIDRDCVHLSPAPLYHGSPLKFHLTTLGYGGTTVVMERFDAEAFLAAVQRYRVSCVQVVPTMLIRLLKLPGEVKARYDISSLRVAVTGSAPCPPPVKEAIIDWWGPIVHEFYAGTEGIGLTYCDSREWLAHRGTVGRQIFGHIHVCDDDGNEVPPGTTGQIYLGGVTSFRYHSRDGKTDEEKTRGARHPRHDDWASYGDIGHLDEDGYLYLTDRKANMIISGGVNIYPQEAENVLSLHPKVGDVAVFGIPHPEMGEQVKAVVEPLNWDDAGPALEAELIGYCREKLAHYKCPRSVDFDQQLPRHPTGKLYKRLVKERYW